MEEQPIGSQELDVYIKSIIVDNNSVPPQIFNPDGDRCGIYKITSPKGRIYIG